MGSDNGKGRQQAQSRRQVNVAGPSVCHFIHLDAFYFINTP